MWQYLKEHVIISDFSGNNIFLWGYKEEKETPYNNQ